MTSQKTILRALAGETLPTPPIWMMRQAGRDLPEYRATRAKADIATIEGALDLYRLQLGSMPTTAQGLAALRSPPQGVDAARYQPGGYIKKLEDDPWGRPYLYASPGQHGEADVWSYGRDGKEGGEGIDADIGSWM